MVRMGVRNEYRVKLGQLLQRDSRIAYPGQKPAERRIEVRIGEKPLSADLN
jgi:hypothetical protein